MLGPRDEHGAAATPNAYATPQRAHRAFFCRMEDDLDERKIPLRMRVGDLPTVNRMERKPGW